MELETDIFNFLPKYPNINQYQDEILNPYTEPDFYANIYKKKEFYDNKLSPTETVPNKPGELMKQQIIIKKLVRKTTT